MAEQIGAEGEDDREADQIDVESEENNAEGERALGRGGRSGGTGGSGGHGVAEVKGKMGRGKARLLGKTFQCGR